MPEITTPLKLSRTGAGKDITTHEPAVNDLLVVGSYSTNPGDPGAVMVLKGAADAGLMTIPGQVQPSWMHRDGGFFTAADGTGVWFLGEHGKVKSDVAGVLPASVFGWNPADFTEDVDLRLAGVVAVNGVAPGLDLKIALRKVTVGGTAGEISYTAGAIVASHTIAAADLAAGDVDTFRVAIDHPATLDKYAVTIEWLNGTWLTGSAVSIIAGLQWAPFVP